MTLFVDASALVAIITQEPDGGLLAQRLAADDHRLTSAVSVWEATVAVARSERMTVAQAEHEVHVLLGAARVSIVAIGPEEVRLAVDAHARFGKGRNPAKLNMGDCFAYACARANGARLLYKGDDFALTDIEPA